MEPSLKPQLAICPRCQLDALDADLFCTQVDCPNRGVNIWNCDGPRPTLNQVNAMLAKPLPLTPDQEAATMSSNRNSQMPRELPADDPNSKLCRECNRAVDDPCANHRLTGAYTRCWNIYAENYRPPTLEEFERLMASGDWQRQLVMRSSIPEGDDEDSLDPVKLFMLKLDELRNAIVYLNSDSWAKDCGITFEAPTITVRPIPIHRPKQGDN